MSTDDEYLHFLQEATYALCEDNIDQTPQDIEHIIQENKSNMLKQVEENQIKEIHARKQHIIERHQFAVDREKFEQERKLFEEKKSRFEDSQYDMIDPDKVIRHTTELRNLHESLAGIAIDNVPEEDFKKLREEEREEIIGMYKNLLKELDHRIDDMTVDQAYTVIQSAIENHNKKSHSVYTEYMGQSKSYVKETTIKPSDTEFDFEKYKNRLKKYHKHMDDLRYAEAEQDQRTMRESYFDGKEEGDFLASVARIQVAREKELEEFGTTEPGLPENFPPEDFWPTSPPAVTVEGSRYESCDIDDIIYDCPSES
jgi:hypothetical protein